MATKKRPIKAKGKDKPSDVVLLDADDIDARDISDSFGAAVPIDTTSSSTTVVRSKLNHIDVILRIDVDSAYDPKARRRVKVVVSRAE
jgi:hypothetical protein